MHYLSGCTVTTRGHGSKVVSRNYRYLRDRLECGGMLWRGGGASGWYARVARRGLPVLTHHLARRLARRPRVRPAGARQVAAEGAVRPRPRLADLPHRALPPLEPSERLALGARVGRERGAPHRAPALRWAHELRQGGDDARRRRARDIPTADVRPSTLMSERAHRRRRRRRGAAASEAPSAEQRSARFPSCRRPSRRPSGHRRRRRSKPRRRRPAVGRRRRAVGAAAARRPPRARLGAALEQHRRRPPLARAALPNGVCSDMLGATVVPVLQRLGRRRPRREVGVEQARTKARPSVDTLAQIGSLRPGGAGVAAAAESGAPESRRWQTQPTDHMSARSV